MIVAGQRLGTLLAGFDLHLEEVRQFQRIAYTVNPLSPDTFIHTDSLTYTNQDGLPRLDTAVLGGRQILLTHVADNTTFYFSNGRYVTAGAPGHAVLAVSGGTKRFGPYTINLQVSEEGSPFSRYDGHLNVRFLTVEDNDPRTGYDSIFWTPHGNFGQNGNGTTGSISIDATGVTSVFGAGNVDPPNPIDFDDPVAFPDGRYTVKADVFDAPDGQSVPAQETVIVDREGPALTVSDAGGTVIADRSVGESFVDVRTASPYIRLDMADGLSGVDHYSITSNMGDNIGPVSFSPSLPSVSVPQVAISRSGEYIVDVFDEAQNLTTLHLTVDRQGPSGSLFAASDFLIKDLNWDDPVNPPSTLSSTVTFTSSSPDLHTVLLRLAGTEVFLDSSTLPLTALGSFTTNYYLAPGDYELVALDDLGNASTAPFTVARLDFSVDPFESRSDCANGACRAFLAARATSTVGMARYEVWSSTGLLLSAPGAERALLGPLEDSPGLTVEAVDLHNNRRRVAAALAGHAFSYPADLLNLSGDPLPCGAGGTCQGAELLPGGIFAASIEGTGLYGPGGAYESAPLDYRTLQTFFGRLLGAYAEAPSAGWGASQTGAFKTTAPGFTPQREPVPAFVQPPTSIPLGRLRLLFRTGDAPDLGDAGGFVPAWTADVGMDNNFTVFFTSATLLPTPFPIKRYAQMRAEVTNLLPEVFDSYIADDPVNAPTGPGTAVHYPAGYFAVQGLYGLAAAGFGQGLTLPGTEPPAPPNTPAGSAVAVNLGPAVGAVFGAVALPGVTTAEPLAMAPPVGFKSLPDGVALDVQTTAGFSGGVALTFGYNPAGLSDIQQSKLRLFHFPAGPGGPYEDVTTSLDAARRQIHGSAASLSPFMVVYPDDAHFRTVSSGGAVLTAASSDAALVRVDTSAPATAAFLAQRLAAGYVLGSDAFSVAPQGVSFTAPMLLQVPVSTGLLAAAGAPGAWTALVRFDPASGEFTPLTPFAGFQNLLSASFSSASGLYAVFAGTDTLAPVSSVSVPSEGYASADGTVFVSTRHLVALAASDEDPGRFAVGGPAIEYGLAGAPDTAYAAPFPLPEGLHFLSHAAVDAYDNRETPVTTPVVVDGGVPEPIFLAGGVPTSTAAFVNVSSAAVLGFSSVDPAQNGVAAGTATVSFAVGITLEECALDSDCRVGSSGEDFTLPPGVHRAFVQAVDRVGNASEEASFELFVGSDTLAPVTALSRSGPGGEFTDEAGRHFIAAERDSSLSPFDPETQDSPSFGLFGTFYAVDPAPALLSTGLAAATTGDFTLYSSTFQLLEGQRLLAFGSADRARNYEALASTRLFVDATPPQAQLAVQGPSADAGGSVTVLSESSRLVLTSTDPVSNGVSAGLAAVLLLLDRTPEDCGFDGSSLPPAEPAAAPGSCANPYDPGVPFGLAGGTHGVTFLPVDRVEHLGALSTAAFLVDDAPPSIAGLVPSGGEAFNAPADSFTVAWTLFDSLDPAPTAQARLIQLEDTGAPNPGSTVVVVALGQLFFAPELDDGSWVLEVAAQDWVLNSTVAYSQPFRIVHPLDSTPPVTQLTLGPPSVVGDPSFVSSRTVISLAATDDLSGVASLTYLIDGSTTAVSTSSTSFSLVQQGTHTLAFFAADSAGNIEAVQVSSITVDNTPPVLAFAFSGSSMTDRLGRTVISTDTLLVLSASDALSGVGTLTYSLDGGPEVSLAVSSVAFSFADEGLHSIFAFAQDRVENRSLSFSTSVVVDVSAPAFGALAAAGADGSSGSDSAAISTTAASVQIPVSDLASGLDATGAGSGRSPLSAIPGTLGLWHFDEPSGSVALSAGGPAGNGTLNFDVTRIPGVIGRAVRVAPADNVSRPDGGVTLPPAASSLINNLPSGTVEFWTRMPNPSANPSGYHTFTVKQADGSNTMFWSALIPQPNSQLWHPANHQAQCFSAFTPDPARWYHIAATWDASTQKIYIDGRLKQDCPSSAPVPDYPNPTCLSIAGACGDTGIGSRNEVWMDEVRILNRALSAAEIAQDASGQAKPFAARLSTDGGLSFTAVSSVELAGVDGVLSGVLSASGLSLKASTSPADATNQVEFTVRDLAGHVGTVRKTLLVNLNRTVAPQALSPADASASSVPLVAFSWAPGPGVPMALLTDADRSTDFRAAPDWTSRRVKAQAPRAVKQKRDTIPLEPLAKPAKPGLYRDGRPGEPLSAEKPVLRRSQTPLAGASPRGRASHPAGGTLAPSGGPSRGALS